MAIHEELNPDIATLPFVTARAMRSLATDNSARTAGVIVVPNRDGTDTVLGVNGVAPWVGDTTPPGRPLDIEATSHLGTALIRWGGELEGGIPSDFRCVRIWAKDTGDANAVKMLVGALSSAGEVNTGVFDAGSVLDVWATALDNAHDRDGSPAFNESVESEHVQVEILPIVSQQEFDEAADNILAAADESVKAQIEQVNKDIQDTSDRIDTKAEEILEAAKADAAAQAGAVDAKVTATNTKVQENADAIERARGNARELLYNGGFEHGTDGWTTNVAGAGFTQASSWCRSGGWRAYLNASAGTRELVSTKPVAVTVGNRYRFRAWYKLLTALSGNDNGGLRLQYTSSTTVTDNTSWTDFTPLVNMQFTGDTWTQAIQEVVIPDGVKWVRARVAFTSPVNAYFDDCSISDVTQLHALDVAVDEVKQAAALAQSTADGRNRIWRQRSDPALDADVKPVVGDLWWQTREASLETYWEGTPNNSVSVLVDHSDEIEHMWIWDGSKWNSHALYAQDLLVNGSVVTELLSATALYGKTVKGGTFLTSNERLVIDNEGLLLKDSGGNATITMLASNGSATFRDVNIIDGSLTTPSLISSDIQGGTVSGATVTGGTVQTVTDANRGIKMTGGNFDIYRSDKTRFLRVNEWGLYINDRSKDVLSFAPIKGEWVLSLKGAIQSGGEISGAAITGAAIRTNTEWQSSEAAKKYRGVVITDGGMFAYKNNGKEEYSLEFTADTGELLLDGAAVANGSFTSPTITAGQVIGANIYTSTDADNRVSITSAGLSVTRGGATVISFDADGTVDLGTSGIAPAGRLDALQADYEETTAGLSQSVSTMRGQVDAQGERLASEIEDRRQYMRFDPDTGLTIGDLTAGDAYSVRLSATRMEFMAGDTTAAYVSNDRLYINNAEVVSTMRIGRFAFLPRENGHMSLQYVG